MNDTLKTVLIVGGVAVGVVVLFRLIQPGTAATTQKPASATDMISISGLVGLGTALFSAIGSGGSSPVGQPTSGAASVGFEQGESFNDFYTGMFGPGSTEVLGA